MKSLPARSFAGQCLQTASVTSPAHIDTAMPVLAFVAHVAIALSGDFILYPDEIMQYLEQGHRLVFGNGVIYWEFFYGQRSWPLPGLIGGVLQLCDAAGLGERG